MRGLNAGPPAPIQAEAKIDQSSPIRQESVPRSLATSVISVSGSYVRRSTVHRQVTVATGKN